MISGLRSGRVFRTGLVIAMMSGGVLAGCRTTSDDVHRWANTSQGPKKLVAVIQHDKYSLDLRVEAALTLVRMPARAGRRVGIELLTQALGEMEPKPRNAIVAKLVPILVAEMKKPPPAAQAGQPAPADPSFPYKDAAFALLTNDGKVLVESDEDQEMIRAAMVEWALADFAPRLDNSSQKFGIEQIFRKLGATSVRGLPKLIQPGAAKIGTMATLVADLGDKATKEAAGQRLVAVAKEVDSERWIKKKEPLVEAANKASRLKVTPKQFAAQLEAYQEEELLRVFASMQKVGGTNIVDYLLDFAANKDKSEKRRAAATNALGGHIDSKNKKHVGAILAIAGGEDTPPQVRDLALRRVGELPRSLVKDDLYKLFKNENWKIRWVAAELILRMSKAEHIDEFMTQIGQNSDGMAITEPLQYGSLIGELDGLKDGPATVEKYLTGRYPVAVRLSALGYYFKFGTKTQVDKVTRFASDRQKVPKCREDADGCAWQCAVGPKEKKELKEVATVGDYVNYCVKPAMEDRTKADLEKEKKDAPKKDAPKK